MDWRVVESLSDAHLCCGGDVEYSGSGSKHREMEMHREIEMFPVLTVLVVGSRREREMERERVEG